MVEVSLETKHVTTLSTNDYPTHFNVHNGPQPNTDRETSVQDAWQPSLANLPYAEGFSERIAAELLKPFNIKVSRKPIRAMCNIFKKQLDKISDEAS